MRRYRSLIALMVALSMLFAMSVTAGAAPFSDVDEDSEYADAFQLLKDLGIFEGYGDGTVGPNDPLTREQFAVVVVRALGATNAARNLSNFVTHFADDAQISDWARGAVAYASARIIQGYPDGTFRPQANVTYAEAFTMLLRALGLDQAIQGPWPVAVISVAHEIGLSEGISGAANAPITRGDMAIATENALFSTWKWDKEEEELVETEDAEDSLIVKKHGWDADDWEDRVGVSKVTGKFDRITVGGNIRVDGKNYSIDYDELVVELNKSAAEAEKKANDGDEFGANDSWENLLGDLFKKLDEDDVEYTVTLTLDKENDKVTKIAVNADTYANGTLSRVTIDRNETDFGTVRVDGVTIDVDDDTDVFVNGKRATLADAREALEDFRDEWGSNANALATVRTRGNDPNNAAIYVSILTDTTVSGTVTSRGMDSDGAWVRIDGTKYYDESDQDLNVDDEVTVLLGHNNKIYIVLDGEKAVSTDVWARVISYTVDSKERYVTTFQLADNTQFTLRVEEDADQAEINAALDDDEINLIFLEYGDDGKLDGMKAAATTGPDHKNVKVLSISSTRITVDVGDPANPNPKPLTLAADVFYWDAADKEFIRRVDIDEDDIVDVYIADDLVMAVIVRPPQQSQQ